MSGPSPNDKGNEWHQDQVSKTTLPIEQVIASDGQRVSAIDLRRPTGIPLSH